MSRHKPTKGIYSSTGRQYLTEPTYLIPVEEKMGIGIALDHSIAKCVGTSSDQRHGLNYYESVHTMERSSRFDICGLPKAYQHQGWLCALHAWGGFVLHISHYLVAIPDEQVLVYYHSTLKFRLHQILIIHFDMTGLILIKNCPHRSGTSSGSCYSIFELA
jgi:hypothetical protein